MRIGIQTWGSLGDILPLASLADGLNAAGHDVTLQVCAVEPHFDYSRVRTSATVERIDTVAAKDRGTFSRLAAGFSEEQNPLKQARSVVETMLAPAEDRMAAAAERLCGSCDLVIGHFFAYPLRVMAEKSSTPYASVMLVHSAVPSGHYPPSGLPNLGRFANRLAWKGVRALLDKNLLAFPNRLRAAQGLPPAHDLINDVWASGRLNLIAVSPTLCPPQDDWDSRHQVCGFFSNAAARFDNPPAEELDAFLDAGAPPVFVTFGSVTPSTPDETSKLLALLGEVHRTCQCRLIVQLPLSADTVPERSKDILIVQTANHMDVFPKCAAVIHHGGAGTTHTVLQTGVPSVVVAHIEEQMFWGRELHSLGVAAKPLSRKGLTADALSAALAGVLASPGMRQAAQSLAPVVRAENGVSVAVELLEKLSV